MQAVRSIKILNNLRKSIQILTVCGNALVDIFIITRINAFQNGHSTGENYAPHLVDGYTQCNSEY